MDPVLHWNSVLLEISRRDFTRGYHNAQQPGPIRTSRAMAIVHLAIHDAIAFKNNPPAAYLNKKSVAHGLGSLMGNVGDIIVGAAVVTLKALYPRFHAFIDDATGNVDAAAFAEGEAVGNAVLAHRAGDGWNGNLQAGQPENPTYGQHRADPFAPGQSQLGPNWGSVTRFMGPAHQHMDPYPGHGLADFLTDPAYKADYDEVQELGAVERRSRSAEQQRIGIYWGYDGANNLGVPPRLYNQVARTIVKARTPGLGMVKTAELFAAINVAMADAGIDAWHYKYQYDLWRPVIGIRNEHGGAADPFWTPLGAPQTNSAYGTLTPNFPAYPSGHASFGAALMQTLRLMLGTGSGPITLQNVLDVEAQLGTPAGVTKVTGEEFTFVSDELDGVASDPGGSIRTRVEKTFANFAEPVWENSVSRIYLGVHWRFDGLSSDTSRKIGGVPLGLAVGEETANFFKAPPSL